MGVIALGMEMDSIYEMIQDNTGMGETGETLIAKNTGEGAMYLNPLRHEPDAALKKVVKFGDKAAIASQEAAKHQNGSGINLDYRGKKVISAWRYIPSLDWGLVAKIDTKEAFAPINNLLEIAVILTFALIITGLLAAFLVSKSLTDPIRDLQQGTEIIGRGQLDHKVGTSAKDEIGGLSRAIDRMSSDLKEVTASRNDLENEIEERKKAEEEKTNAQTYLQSSLSSIPDGVLMLDKQGRFSYVNPAFLEWLGRESKDSIGKTVPEVSPPFLSPETTKIIAERAKKRLQTGETITGVEVNLIAKDNRLMPITYSAAGIRDNKGNVLGEVVFLKDITLLKQAEDKLRVSLEDLKRSNKELEQFAYVASHDLQEPLRMVSSFAQLLERRYKDKLDQDAKDFIQFAVSGSIRMQRLINDLLIYSRVGTRGKEPEIIDSHSALGEALVNLGSAVEKANAIITNDDLPQVKADPGQMSQLFQNLIGNAIKFSGQDHPHIHISTQDKGKEWVFSVKDNGIGIEPQYFERIFVIFQRLHGVDEYPGTGIGLALCKRIVERHGGRIWVESELGKGATFFFSLPK